MFGGGACGCGGTLDGTDSAEVSHSSRRELTWAESMYTALRFAPIESEDAMECSRADSRATGGRKGTDSDNNASDGRCASDGRRESAGDEELSDGTRRCKTVAGAATTVGRKME